MFHNNFGKCEPINKIISPVNSWGTILTFGETNCMVFAVIQRIVKLICSCLNSLPIIKLHCKYLGLYLDDMLSSNSSKYHRQYLL